MKIGIIGLGSIGSRHAHVLNDLGYKPFVLRRKKGEVDKDLVLEQFEDEGLFYQQGLDGVIIASPTALHKGHMKKPLSLNIPILVEKPLVQYAKECSDYLKYQDLIKVAYCLRFHEITKKLNELISSGIYGDLYKCDLYCGQYLPNWHPGEDYSQKYFSRKDLGGGALRTLSHEIDLAKYLFGDLAINSSFQSKRSNLKIDVDDYVFIFGEFIENKALFSIELDYLNVTPDIRYGRLCFTNGILRYSFSKGTIVGVNAEGDEKIWLSEDPKSLSARMYKEQIQSFIGFVKGDKGVGCTSLLEACYTMNFIEEVEKNND